MNGNITNQEKQYYGLLGLDRLPRVVKIINLCVSVTIGSGLAFISWFDHIYDGVPSYISLPFLPLVFAWPLCAVLLWLRLTGIRWFWCLIASAVLLVGYCMLHILGVLIAGFLAG